MRMLLGIELDGIAAARKLKELNIGHIVTQHSYSENTDGVLLHEGNIISAGSDELIPNSVSLYVGLRKAGINDSPRMQFYGNSSVEHSPDLPEPVERKVRENIAAFFQ